ncbi:hypothetical protein Xbud_03837 [Xenorhabdus budapestensis]|uniref:Uncharacterized protein n=1 Tax=Xenorhabdus budapestensis TaxID=290110 RepID=A0A2D0IJL1_XENBU|nr:hypothetical protein Xbud_03837 [Xenorhabdus budapestensis]
MQCGEIVPLVFSQQAFECLFLALQRMDSFGLFAGFIDRQHQTTVQQFFIHINGGGGEHQHHRAFHGVAFGDEVSGRFILARARHRQLAITLQQLQRIGGLPYPFFFGDS